MNKKKLLSLLLCLVLAVSMLAACSGGGGNEGGGSQGGSETPSETPSDVTPGGTMLIGMGAEPITMNPNGKVDSNFSIMAPLMFNKLMTITATGKIVPDLAESYEIGDDDVTYTFKLPAGVKFSDGEPLTSEDVKFSFEEIVKQGGQAAGSLSGIESIECPDETTVVIKLSAPNASFLGSLGYDGVYVLPKHVYEGKDWLDKDGMQEPVGSGPFKFSEWKTGVSFSVVKNENYYKGPDLPYLDGITYSFISDVDTALQSFQNGELDIMGLLPSEASTKTLMADPNYNCYVNMYASRFYLGFNMDKAPFNDVNFRQAVARAIDIDDLINKAMTTTCVKAKGYFSPLFDWANDPAVTIPEFDLEEAQKYMEATGLEKDADGFYCHVTLDTYNYEPFPSMTQVIKAQLAEIGIDVTISTMEYAAWDEKVAQKKDFEMTVVGGYVGPDVSNAAPHFTTGGYFNAMNYSNPEVDDLMAKGAAAVKQEERAPFYQQVCQILKDDMPMVVIGEWVAYTPVPAYVHNYSLSDEVKDEIGTSDLSLCWMEH